VIPTFIIDEPILISIGFLSGLFIPKGWRSGLFQTRAFWAGTYLALGFTGLAAYGYAVAPDWMFMYLVPARSVPFWMVVYAFILYYVLFLAGFLLTPQLVRLHPRLPLLALAFGLVAAALVVMPLLPAYRIVASYEDFHRGIGVPLAESEVSRKTLLPTILLGASGLLFFLWARRQKEA